MTRTIYNSINDEGLLKAAGPFRILSADTSFSGIVMPRLSQTGKLNVTGKMQIIGNTRVSNLNKTSK